MKLLNRHLFPFQWNILKLTNKGNSYKLCRGNLGVKIAIIDSGVDYQHPDLRKNIDFINSRNFSPYSNDITDYNGHGTMVGGIISANGDLMGIAPQVSLVVCKITESRKFKLKHMFQAMKHAINCNVDVINLSLSAYLDFNSSSSDVASKFNELISEAKDKNIAIVTSSGNQNINLNTKTKLHIPGFNPNVIVVGATNKSGEKASYSNYGNIDYVAPGGEWLTYDPSQIIITTYPPYVYDMDPIRINLGLSKGYTVNFGTSLACAQVSGAIGLIISCIYQFTKEKPDIKTIKYYLEEGIVDINHKNEHYLGKGEINVYNSLNRICIDYTNI